MILNEQRIVKKEEKKIDKKSDNDVYRSIFNSSKIL